ncbi:10905_t:CDS:1, partial [Funneliformis mosseae]
SVNTFSQNKLDLTTKSEELSNVCFRCKYFKEMIKTQEKEANTKKETINMLEKTIKERDEEVRTKQEIISNLE